MGKRFSRVYTNSPNIYLSGSPVILLHGGILRDNVTSNVMAQFKMKNINDKEIKAVTIEIKSFDIKNEPIGNTLEYQYLDIMASRDDEFGEQIAIPLEENRARSIEVKILEVVFSDSSTWTPSKGAWEPLESLTKMEEIRDEELAKQLKIEFGADIKNLPLISEDIWICKCGGLNYNYEYDCHICNTEITLLKEKNEEYFKDYFNGAIAKRLDEEKLAREKFEKKEKGKNKIVMRVGIVVVIALIGFVIFLDSNGAKAFFLSKQIEEIGVVTAASEEAIIEAEEEFKSLSEEGKKKVGNIKELELARLELDNIITKETEEAILGPVSWEATDPITQEKELLLNFSFNPDGTGAMGWVIATEWEVDKENIIVTTATNYKFYLKFDTNELILEELVDPDGNSSEALIIWEKGIEF